MSGMRSLGCRASITCNIAPSRAPDGSRSPHSSIIQRPFSSVLTRYATAWCPSSTTRNSVSRVPIGARPESSRFFVMPKRTNSSLRSSAAAGNSRRAHLDDRRQVLVIAAAHQHGGRATTLAIDLERRFDERHRHEIEALVKRRSDLREQHRELLAFGHGGVEHAHEQLPRAAAARCAGGVKTAPMPSALRMRPSRRNDRS